MIIWITGGSTGIGKEVALQYCATGAIVFATARTEDKLQTLLNDAKNLSGTIHIRSLDVTNADDIADAFDWLVTNIGMPDKVILNAGTYFPTPATSFHKNEHDQIMEVNYGGVVNCLSATLPAFVEQQAGQIAIIASVAGYRGLPYASAYSASKAALIALAESLREELKQQNVDLKLINPGFVRTPLTDQNKFSMPFLMEVEDAADKIVKGLEKGRFEIAFPFPFTWIMKFLRVLPDWAFFKISRKALE